MDVSIKVVDLNILAGESVDRQLPGAFTIFVDSVNGTVRLLITHDLSYEEEPDRAHWLAWIRHGIIQR